MPIGDREAIAQVWRVDVGRVPLFLLDVDHPENDPRLRWISSRLYVGDAETRLGQYVLLGVGGVRALTALGIEPAANVAKVAQDDLGIETLVRFFGRETARDLVAEGRRADLIAANNVMAHVPDLNDFVAGFEILLADAGVVTIVVGPNTHLTGPLGVVMPLANHDNHLHVRL